VLLVGGLLGLFYGHFEYTKETTRASSGIQFSVAEKETAVIPSWVSLGVMVAGSCYLLPDANSHAQRPSSGLTTPRPPRLRTCV